MPKFIKYKNYSPINLDHIVIVHRQHIESDFYIVFITVNDRKITWTFKNMSKVRDEVYNLILKELQIIELITKIN